MIEGRFSIVPASYVLLLRETADGGTEVLLQLRQNTGFMDGHWASAAAGHVEAGETAHAAALREAREELGLESIELHFVTAMQRTNGPEPIEQRIDFFFAARTWQGEPRILEAAKAAELRWCRLDGLDELPGPVVPHERHVLDGLHQQRLAPYETFGFSGAPAVEPLKA